MKNLMAVMIINNMIKKKKKVELENFTINHLGANPNSGGIPAIERIRMQIFS